MTTTSSSKRIPVDEHWGRYKPMKSGTVVRFVTESKVTRKSPPFDKDVDSGDETETLKKTLAVTMGDQQEQGVLLVHFIHRALGVDKTALFQCRSVDVEVMNIVIFIR